MTTPPAASTPTPVRTAQWRVVVPVKDARHGKSRLTGAVGADRTTLSRAVAEDTLSVVAQAVGVDALVVVSGDAEVSATWRARGACVVEDPGTGLNDAVAAGLAVVGADARVAVLLGDVPALDAASLLAALDASTAHEQAFVPDAEGTGTVLRTGTGFTPRFGPGSAALHASDGAVRLELDLPRLRTDVDDAASLAAVRRLGPGPATRSVLARRASAWIRSMQATVHRYDPDTLTGSVLRDDGVELPFGAPAVEASGLRLLRSGQRLTVDVVDDVVVALRIVGIGPGQRIR